MPYDEELVHRLRGALVDVDGVTERRMFGGYAFLVDRHMCVCASRSGGLMVRIDPGTTDAAVAEPGVERRQGAAGVGRARGGLRGDAATEVRAVRRRYLASLGGSRCALLP